MPLHCNYEFKGTLKPTKHAVIQIKAPNKFTTNSFARSFLRKSLKSVSVLKMRKIYKQFLIKWKSGSSKSRLYLLETRYIISTIRTN